MLNDLKRKWGVQIPRYVLVSSMSTEEEQDDERDEFEEAGDAELRDPEEQKESFAPFWIGCWGTERDRHGD